MDDHEICRKHIQKIEAERDAAYEELADLEITLSEKDSLIASLSAENDMYRKDREVLIPEGAVG